MIEAIALSSIAGAAAGAIGAWVSLRTVARRDAEALEDNLMGVRNERDAARRDASSHGAEIARLRALFEVPAGPPSAGRDAAWAPFAAHAERALARLGRDALANVSAVGSAESALPIACDGTDERLSRLYLAVGGIITSAGEAIAREFAPDLTGWDNSSARASQISVEIADETSVRVARLDADEEGLIFVTIGPSGRLSEAAWGRALVALRQHESRTLRPSRPDRRISVAVSLDGVTLPQALLSALARAGVSSVRYVAPGSSTSWESLANEGLARIPGAPGARVVFRVLLDRSEASEVVALRLGRTGWIVATVAEAGSDPSRLLDQVAGYLRFRERGVATTA